ncbi:MAG: hypothetical protein AAGE18_06865 [Pseudomonadota bacterium]
MTEKGDLAEDPRGLIFEAYRIDGIGMADCRTIFFDWALGETSGAKHQAVETLLAHYGPTFPDHPMTEVLREGLRATGPAKRTGRAAARRARG